MRKLIDKIIRKEEDKKLCPNCDQSNDKRNQHCSKCGHDFNSPTISTPEDGIND